MPRLFKRLILFLVLPLVLLAGAGALLGWLALRQFTPGRVVQELEAVCNARVQLDGCSLSLFSAPARLELTGLHFHPRDAEADGATPVAGRPPIKIGNTYLRMRRAVLEADLAALILRRELRVENFLIDTGDVKFDLLPSGENSLSELFRSPATVHGRPNPARAVLAPVAAAVAVAATAATAATAAVDPATTKPGAAERGGAEPTADDGEAAGGEKSTGPVPVFHARDLRGPVALKKLTFVDTRLRIRNRKSRAVTELNQLNLEVDDVAVDPAHLATANRAAIALSSRIWIDGGKKNPVRLAEMTVTTKGTLVPFDAATGRLQPDFQFTTVVAQGSTLQSLPALEKIEKNLARARRAGLKIDDLGRKAVLAGDATLTFRLQDNRLSLTQPAVFDFGDYTLAVEAGSSLDAATESHEVRAAWIASQAVSDKALGGAKEFLGSLGDDVASELRGLLIDPIVKDGRLHMAFVTSGELTDPEIRIAHPLQDLTDQLKDAGRGLLERFKEK